jgi:hypothetical protein
VKRTLRKVWTPTLPTLPFGFGSVVVLWWFGFGSGSFSFSPVVVVRAVRAVRWCAHIEGTGSGSVRFRYGLPEGGVRGGAATLPIRYVSQPLPLFVPFYPTPPWGPLSSLFFPLGGGVYGKILPILCHPLRSIYTYCGAYDGDKLLL